MIHHTLRGPEPRRRIAVVQIPRAQRSKLGWIRPGWAGTGANTTELNTWTPVYDLTTTLTQNSSSTTADQWAAIIQRRQAAANQQTPGTLAYTPAPPDPSGATIEAPWTSWQTDPCNPDAGSANALGVKSPVVSAGDFAQTENTWLFIAGLLGAAASLVYLRNANKRGGGA